ncbi:MAG: hypothetical protein ACKV2T_25345 [Kofleriaceae bacterium]
MPPPFEPPFSTLTNFKDLCDFLREEGVVFTADVDAHVVEIPPHSAGVSCPLVIRWEWQTSLVQLIQLMFDVPATTRAATERAIGLLNHAAPRAGFAMDPERGFAYYRLTLQRDERDAVTVGQLNRGLAATVSTVRDYLPLLHSIAYASNATLTDTSPDDVTDVVKTSSDPTRALGPD